MTAAIIVQTAVEIEIKKDIYYFPTDHKRLLEGTRERRED
jgi:hypothetical protein